MVDNEWCLQAFSTYVIYGFIFGLRDFAGGIICAIFGRYLLY